MSELDNHSQSSDKYTDSFSFKENKSYLKISFERIAFIFFVFFILAIILHRNFLCKKTMARF